MSNQLHCSHCASADRFPLTTWRCPQCHGPLSWTPPAAFSRSDIQTDAHFVWRYAAILPVDEAAITFGEIETPLTGLDIDGVPLMAKLDFITPTGSFKDRGCAVLINALVMAGVQEVVEDSSGNAAASVAAYAARASIPCTVFAPAAASPGKLAQAAAYGARVERFEGSRSDVARAAETRHDAERGVIYASHNWHPYFIAGVCSWALETWEQLGYRAPDNVVVPAGSGSLALGAYVAFSLLRNGGELRSLPRIFTIQPEACAPIVTAIEQNAAAITEFDRRPSIAEGASIAYPVRGAEILGALRGSNGGAASVTEPEIVAALLEACSQGLYIEPTSALAVAGARKLLQSGAIARSETTVLVLTGSGLKATETISSLLVSASGPRAFPVGPTKMR